MIDKERYTRQLMLDEVGIEGQEKLACASVLIVGLGGLGAPISMQLVAAGVGRVGIVDFDIVSMSNLPRQLLYTEADLGHKKVDCAFRRLSLMNSTVTIEPRAEKVTEENVEAILSAYDIVVDGTDNLEVRYIIDSAARKLGKPYVYGAIRGFEGMVSVFHCNGAGGYSDLFPREACMIASTPPPVMATTPSLIGTLEANEVLKLAVGYGEPLCGKLLKIDLRTCQFDIFEL